MGLFSDLFGEDQDAKIERWKNEMVEDLPREIDAIQNAGIDEEGDLFICVGPVVIFIDFLEEDSDTFVRIFSILGQMPQENLLPFYRHLLELNASWPATCRIGMDDDRVVLTATLDMEDLADTTFYSCVGQTMSLAQALDEDLVKEFGMTRWLQE